MGQHGSPTNTVHFEAAACPRSALMGRENDGFRIAVGELAGGRIGVAALSLGIARAAMDAAKTYVQGAPAVRAARSPNSRASNG